MGFTRQEYWSGLSFPSPGDLANPGSNQHLLHLLPLAGNSLPLSHLEWKSYHQHWRLEGKHQEFKHKKPSEVCGFGILRNTLSVFEMLIFVTHGGNDIPCNYFNLPRRCIKINLHVYKGAFYFSMSFFRGYPSKKKSPVPQPCAVLAA